MRIISIGQNVKHGACRVKTNNLTTTKKTFNFFYFFFIKDTNNKKKQKFKMGSVGGVIEKPLNIGPFTYKVIHLFHLLGVVCEMKNIYI